MSPRMRKGKATRRVLVAEWLEARTMLSASGFSTGYVELAASSSGVYGYTPAQIGLRLQQYLVRIDRRKWQRSDDRHYRRLQRSEYRFDLATFDSTLGIAAPPSFKVVNQSGGSTLPSTDPSEGWEGEIALDVERRMPSHRAQISLVEANNASDSNLFAAVNYARQQPNVSVISMSWGSDDSAANAASDQSLSAAISGDSVRA